MEQYGILVLIFIISAAFVTSLSFILMMNLKRNLKKERAFQEERERLLEALSDERIRTMDAVGKNLHDHILQVLNFAEGNLEEALDTRDDPRPYVQQALGMIKEIEHDIGNLSYTLSSKYISKNGLIDVLNRLVESIQNATSSNCTFEIKGRYERINEEDELLIYRIVQQAFSNAVKHAKAANITINFDNHSYGLAISVIDDGIGFNIASLSKSKGIGILNMRERASLLGAELEILSKPNFGTMVQLCFSKKTATK